MLGLLSASKIDLFGAGYAFENEGGGRNVSTQAIIFGSIKRCWGFLGCTLTHCLCLQDSTGAAAAIGGDANNARVNIAYPFPTYSTVEAFAQKYEVVRASMDTLFNFIM